MTCGLLDLACHAREAAFSFVMALPWWVHLIAVAGFGFMIWGVIERVLAALAWIRKGLERIGGWKAALGGGIIAAAALLGVAVTFFGGVAKPAAKPVPKPAAKPKDFPFGTERTRPKQPDFNLDQTLKNIFKRRAT